MENDKIIQYLTADDHEIKSLKHRVDACEKQISEYGQLVRSVDKLATNMEYMAKEQAHQSLRLDKLEQVPVEDYKHYKRSIVTAIIGTLIGAILGAVLALIIK